MQVSKMMCLVGCLIMLTGCNALKSKETKTAEQKTKRVAGLNIQLGMAYLESKNMQRAKEKLLLALDDAPNLPEAQYSMGYFYEAIGDPDTAKTFYLKALALAPTRGDTQNNYGTFLCRNKQYKESIRHFEIALKDPSYLSTAEANENAGLCAQQIPDEKLALAYFNRAVLQDANRTTSLYQLAKINYKKNQYRAAQSYLNLYVALAPETAESELLQARLNKKLYA